MSTLFNPTYSTIFHDPSYHAYDLIFFIFWSFVGALAPSTRALVDSIGTFEPHVAPMT